MAGKPTPDGRRVHMNVKLSESEAAVIDAARGTTARGTWLREAALAVANGMAPKAHGGRDDTRSRSRGQAQDVAQDGIPGECSAGDAVPSPAGASQTRGARVPGRRADVPPVVLKPASEITTPARCPHPGTRQIGGWCVKCQAQVESGGRLPEGWVASEGWAK
jgi:hypothetical protein